MDKSQEQKEKSATTSEGKYYLVVFILPGDGTPRILPTFIQIEKASYEYLQKLFNKPEPIPAQFKYKTPDGKNFEVFNFCPTSPSFLRERKIYSFFKNSSKIFFSDLISVSEMFVPCSKIVGILLS